MRDPCLHWKPVAFVSTEGEPGTLPLKEGSYELEHPRGEAFCAENPEESFMGDASEGPAYVEAKHRDYAAWAGLPRCLDA